MSTPEIILHGTELSGHAHRVELLLRMLGLPYRLYGRPGRGAQHRRNSTG